MILQAIYWYLFITLLGWLAFPLAYCMLPGLPDRGYSASRALGLLVWGYFYWLLGSLGLLNNDSGGLLLALFLLALIVAWALHQSGTRPVLSWLRAHLGLIGSAEILFLVVFSAYAFVRAANPEAVGTEKPMELAFINAILRSPTLPPHDPWLSGYAISYYYFGYVLVAMLAMVTGATGSVAFNLGIVMTFALSASGAYGLVFNLLNLTKPRRAADQFAPSGNLLAALLGPLFLLIVSNLEGFLHAMHNRGLFWQIEPDGTLVSPFWSWLDIKDLNVPPQQPFSWIPDRFWWWWRASRVIQDYDLAGGPREIINEFPFFSYLLADLHPHVLVMPFTLLAIMLALNVLSGGAKGYQGWFQRAVKLRTLVWIGLAAVPVGIYLVGMGAPALQLRWLLLGALSMIGGAVILLHWRKVWQEHGMSAWVRSDLGDVQIGLPIHIGTADLLLSIVVLGGLGFLNTWDFPFYVALFAGAYALRLIITSNHSLGSVLPDFTWLGLLLGLGGALFYLPFYLGFSSQVGGLLPNLIYPTRGAHLWVMFAPLFLPIFVFQVYHIRRGAFKGTTWQGLGIAAALMLSLWIFALLFGLGITLLPGAGNLFLSSLAASDRLQLLIAAIGRRLTSPGGWISLLVLLGLNLALFLRLNHSGSSSATNQSSEVHNPNAPIQAYSTASLFVLLLILLGALLVIGPEFVYLRDLFGWRMNTIFKFYFQAWLVWSIVAAFASAFLFTRLRGFGATLFSLVWICILGMSLVYPVLSLWNKTNGFRPSTWTLDSADYFQRQNPDEMAAIQWLSQAPLGVVAEAIPPEGGSYSQYSRVATFSGQPALLGWVGHENQWRGGNEVIGSRLSDLRRLYCSRDWNEALSILAQYHIRYVFIAPLEHNTYRPDGGSCALGLVEVKFQRNLPLVFEAGQVKVYEYAP